MDDDGGVYLQPSEFQRFAALVRAQALDEAAARASAHFIPGHSVAGQHFAKAGAVAILALKDRTEPA